MGGRGGGYFQKRRKAEMGDIKAKRDGRQVCRICRGSHPFWECPRLVDGGRFQARWNYKTAQMRYLKGKR